MLKGPFTLLHFLRASAAASCISAGRQKISYLCVDAAQWKIQTAASSVNQP